MSEVTRAFDPRQARNPHTGEWITAGQGLAGHLHGKPVEGRQANGTTVHGTYAGKGKVRAGGRAYPVTHVRAAPAARVSDRLAVGAGPIGEGPAGSDYRRLGRHVIRAEEIVRGGHWLHNWVPLDAQALKEKHHGHVPPGAKVGQTKIGTGLPATPPGHVHVWDVQAGKMRTVTKAEAAAGHQRYGRATFRPGSPAAGEVDKRAMALAKEGAGEGEPTWKGVVGGWRARGGIKRLESSLPAGSPVRRPLASLKTELDRPGKPDFAALDKHMAAIEAAARKQHDEGVTAEVAHMREIIPTTGKRPAPTPARETRARSYEEALAGPTGPGGKGWAHADDTQALAAAAQALQYKHPGLSPKLVWEGAMAKGLTSQQLLALGNDPDALDALQWGAPPKRPARRAGLAPEPRGKPGGPGLYHMKGAGHSAYFQHIVNDLIEGGTPPSRAYSLAWGILRNFAAGHDGKGNRVSAETQAKAVAALAQENKTRAEAKATRSTAMGTDYDADGLDGSWDGDHDDLPDLTGLDAADFAAAAAEDPEFGDWLAPAGDVQRAAKLGSGARFAALKASLAGKGIRDPGALAAHIGRQKYGKGRFHALASAARKRKGGPAMASRSFGELVRYYPLEECRIMRAAEGESSGRVVEAYAAIYDTPTKVTDHQGKYIEEIARTAFNDVLEEIHPDRNGGYWNAVCLFNHGMTVHGTPAERFSLPAGVTRHISSEGKGLLTRTEYAATPLGEELLELVNLGALRSQSFTGGIVRSNPMLRYPGEKYTLGQRVRRLVLGLREYGLCPFAAYTGAEVLGVRMQLPDAMATGGWDEDSYSEPEEEAGEPAAEPVLERSTGNRLYRLRAEEMLAQRGIRLDG